MKKLLVLIILIAGAVFALSKWSPGTLDRIAIWKKRRPAETATIPKPEPAPTPVAPGTAPGPTPSAPLTSESPAPVLQPPAPVAAETNPQSPTASTPPTPAPPPEPPVVVDRNAQVVVLCYHRLEGPSAGTYSITPELFEQHMQRLKDGGLSVISMRDFLAWRRDEKTIPAKSVLITIDDGYASAFEVARPILKKFGYPWTYFVYTNYIERGGKSITWDQLATLRDEGVEIGSHTVSHQDLRDPRGKTPQAYGEWLHTEIIESKKQLEERLGIRCAVFAYPVGGWNSEVVDLVHEAGYEAAFTVFGQRITHSAPAERLGRYAWDAKRPQDIELAFKFIGSVSAGAAIPQPSGQAAPVLLSLPGDGETIMDPRPTLKANLAAMGTLDPSSIGVRLSGIGIIPSTYEAESKTVKATPPEALKPGHYTVTIVAKSGGKRVEAGWSFQVAPPSSARSNDAHSQGAIPQ